MANPHAGVCRAWLDTILQAGIPHVFRALSTAEYLAVLFDSMAHHLATAMRTCWRQGMDRALEGIKGLATAGQSHRESFVVVIPTYITLRHGCFASTKEHLKTSPDGFLRCKVI